MPFCGFCHFGGQQNEIEESESENIKKILGSCQRDEEDVEHEGDGNTKYLSSLGAESMGRETERIENQRKNRLSRPHHC